MHKLELDQWWAEQGERVSEIVAEEQVGGTYGAYVRSAHRIRQELGMDVSVDSLRRHAMLQRRQPTKPVPPRLRIDDVLDIPVRPFSPIAWPPAPEVTSGTWITAALYGDSHEPFGDQECLSVVWDIISDLQPHIIIHMGDLVDCYGISRFDKDPRRLLTLQDEVDAARTHLWHLRDHAPTSRIVLLEGNHEDRLRRVVYAMQGSERALAQLRVVQEALAWPKLLDLDGIGVEWVPMHEQSSRFFLPKFLTLHGSLVRSRSAYTARAEHDRYGVSGASGHTHRKATHYHKDHNGNHVWLETGCTCLLRQEYTVDPDWQQGLNVIHFNTTTGAFHIEDVYVHQGNALWRNRDYTCRIVS